MVRVTYALKSPKHRTRSLVSSHADLYVSTRGQSSELVLAPHEPIGSEQKGPVRNVSLACAFLGLGLFGCVWRYRLRTKQIFGGRYVTPLCRFSVPRYAATQIFVRAQRARRKKQSREIPPSTRAESGLSGADRNSQKNDLLLACFWPRPNVVSRAARIIDLCLSPAHATEYGHQRPVQHCCE